VTPSDDWAGGHQHDRAAQTEERDPQREEAAHLLVELHALPADSPRRRPVRDHLVEMHLPLVRYLARRFAGRNAAFEDIVQVGAIGLLKAIDRFDPGRGLEFSTYATPTILGEIRRYFRDTGWLLHVPRRAQELQATLARARGELTQQLQRAPTVRELAEKVGVDRMQVVEAIDVARGYSGVPLDALTDDGEESRKDRLAEDDVDLERVELREELRPALRELSERDRRILVLRFVAGKTQTEIAEVIGVSQMQISRLISRSLDQLRERLSSNSVGAGQDSAV
jgi:RNA polymerase sigma-B factor